MTEELGLRRQVRYGANEMYWSVGTLRSEGKVSCGGGSWGLSPILPPVLHGVFPLARPIFTRSD